MDIGRALKYYREIQNMTQWDISSLAGINDKYYGRMERNESSPTIARLEKVCIALNIQVSTLIRKAEEYEK